MERITRSHFNLMTNEEQSPNLCCENSPLVLPKPSKGIFPPGGQGAFFSGPLGVLEQQTGNNSSPVLHPGWRGIWKATVPFVFQLYPGCVQAPSRLVGLRDLQTGSNVGKGLEIYISLSQLIPDLWDMKKKIREHWVKEKKRDLFFPPFRRHG